MLCQVNLAAIQAAHTIIRPLIRETPVIHSGRFSSVLGQPVYLKLENLQRTGSFKIRGASYKMHHLAAAGEVKAIMAISAGNHAQGVALASRSKNIHATVFMPEDASLSKVQATQGYGAEVICTGKTFDETREHAMNWLADHPNVTFVSPFDDDDIITGQGSCGLELHAQIPDLDTVVVPVGGGGLISGMAIALKQLNPKIRIIGVQTLAVPSLYTSFHKRKLISAPYLSTIADGIAIKQPAQRNYEVIRHYVDDMVVVDEEEITRALFVALQYKHIIAEGAGIVGLSALLSQKIQANGPTAVVISGGNIDVKLLDSIIRKGMMQVGRYLTFKTLIKDSPGSLKKVLQLIANQKGNVLSVQHARFRSNIPLDSTEIEVEIETRNQAHANTILDEMQAKGYDITRL
jgi:threonine dehydratase